MSDDAHCAELRARLAEAEAAFHKLMTGGGTTWVAFGGGRSVSYSAANAGHLLSYINDLRDQIAACCGGATDAAMVGKRATVRFQF